jgi:hypothetical protein
MSVSRHGRAPRGLVVGRLIDAVGKENRTLSRPQTEMFTQRAQNSDPSLDNSWKRGHP